MKKTAPSFATNPGYYGYKPGNPNASLNSSQTARSNQLRLVTPKINKEILPDEYNPELLVKLERLPNFEPKCINPTRGTFPELKIVNPQTDIYIDANYQRRLQSIDLVEIEKIADNFDWRAIKALTVFRMPDGRLRCTDGQRTALAAVYRGFTEYPALIYDSELGNEIKDQAESFVGTNSNRRAIPAAELLTALIIGGSPDEIEFAKILKKNKIQPIGINARSSSTIKVNETICISTLRECFFRLGKDNFAIMCAILAGAELRPIKGLHVWAAHAIIGRSDVTKLNVSRMSTAIRSIIDKHAILEAKANTRHSSKRTSVSKELASIWLKRYQIGVKTNSTDAKH